MAIVKQVQCDLCSHFIVKELRMRIAVRRDEDRPESAEYLDIGACCDDKSIADLVKRAEENRPVMADGYKA